ncbi:MAG: hypothetical protein AMXMBFR13_11670 [Phycisphaerae bacterium]
MEHSSTGVLAWSGHRRPQRRLCALFAGVALFAGTVHAGTPDPVGQQPPPAGDVSALQLLLPDESKTRLNAFAAPTAVTTNTDWPYRGAAQVNARFKATGFKSLDSLSSREIPTSRTLPLKGSGVLIDPKHVLTAGHNIYRRFFDHTSENRRFYIRDWGYDLEVVPGGKKSSRPYGTATMLYWFTYKGYTDNYNLDKDVAVIELDRHVGALTDWYGYGTTTNCGEFTGVQFGNVSYPQPRPYRGDMHETSGTFDSCQTSWYNSANWWGQQVIANSEPHGGMSGSGFWDPQHIVRAIFSNDCKSGSTKTCAVRLQPFMYNDIQEQLEDARPRSGNLVPLDIKRKSGLVQAGASIEEVSFLVLNYSKDAWDGEFTVDVYLSQDRKITEADTKIDSRKIALKLDSLGRHRVKLDPSPRVPISLSPTTEETRYLQVGVILKTDGDPAISNSPHSQDTITVGVTRAGACCRSADGQCTVVPSEYDCTVAQGQFAGYGVDCTPDPCPGGACCNTADGSCFLTSGPACTAPNQMFMGLNTTCEPNLCPQPNPGACCDVDGGCTVRTPAACAAMGHEFLGENVTCDDPNPCARQEPVGACCDHSTGGCEQTTEAECDSQGRDFVGEGIGCSPNPCQLMFFGACCDPATGECVIDTHSNCENIRIWEYKGDNTTCEEDTCPVPEGACCDGEGNCSLASRANCTAVGGEYQGDQTVCDPNPCPPPDPVGACCDGYTGDCTEAVTSGVCTSLGGTYGGDGSVCATTACVVPPTGACCDRTLGSCSIQTQPQCEFFGGTFLGEGVTCSPDSCTGSVGACCEPDGACQVRTSEACDAEGGSFTGLGTNCDPNGCPQPPVGTCCLPSSECVSATLEQCTLSQGSYGGDGTDCASNPCPPAPLGACCDGQGDCHLATSFECGLTTLNYLGDGSSCTDSPCQSLPTGGCCYGEGNCSDQTQSACLGSGGEFLGEATSCATEACPEPEVTGACCEPDGSCAHLSREACETDIGTYLGDGTLCGVDSCTEGDLDGDRDVDADDFLLFVGGFGSCFGDEVYESFAMDYEPDGCINFLDYQLWLQAYRDFQSTPASPPPLEVFGDFDRDADVDQEDFGTFQACLTGPNGANLPAGCEASDLDGDADVDQDDFGILQRCISGPGEPYWLSCRK